jgi:hypothetical protein
VLDVAWFSGLLWRALRKRIGRCTFDRLCVRDPIVYDNRDTLRPVGDQGYITQYEESDDIRIR